LNDFVAKAAVFGYSGDAPVHVISENGRPVYEYVDDHRVTQRNDHPSLGVTARPQVVTKIQGRLAAIMEDPSFQVAAGDITDSEKAVAALEIARARRNGGDETEQKRAARAAIT